MDLQVHIEPHGSEWYMPGDDVKGWVRCRSECFHQGTAFSVLSVHTSLAGECCTFRISHNKTRTDSDEIFNRSVTLYDANQVPSRRLVESTSEYVKFPFKLVLPEVTDTEIGVPGSDGGRLPLPPSFCPSHNQKYRYIKYWVAAWALAADGSRRSMDKKYILVMPWDSQPRKPTLKWPRLISSDPYILQEPADEWKVVFELIPLTTTIDKRSKFFGQVKAEKVSPMHTGEVCDQCRMDIYGPFFVCICTSCDFIWCWSCLADPNHEHNCGHAFARVDGERGPTLSRRKDVVLAAARETIARRKGESTTIITDHRHEQVSPSTGLRKTFKHFASTFLTPSRSSSNVKADIAKQPQESTGIQNQNNIVEVTAEAKYEIWVPKEPSFPHGANIPILTKITISSITESSLPELLPALPWNAAADTDAQGEPDGRNGPAICLRVYFDSRVDNCEEIGHWWTTWWPNIGEWFKPARPDPSNTPTPMAFSRDWTEPSRNDATGKWDQTAVVCSWIHRPLLFQNKEKFHEPQINLRVLRSCFSLEMKHRVADHSINIVLSKMPWTSGIYRHPPAVARSNRSLIPSVPAISGHEPMPSAPPPYKPN